MEVLFWASAFVIVYVYLGYPAALALWARLAPAPLRRDDPPAELPAVSIVVAVRNEAVRLRARLENLLTLDYPPLRQIIVVSDGSADGTLDVIRSFGSDVDAIALPPTGKPAALNAGVARARHDILVFADARQIARDALRQLVAGFGDPAVGAACVSPPAV